VVVVGGGAVGGVVVGGGAVGGVVGGGGIVVGGGVVGAGAAGAFDLGDWLPFGFPEVVDVCDVGGVEVPGDTDEAGNGDGPAGFASTTTDHLPHVSVMFPFT
jgi:hypothetical protein